MLGSQVALGVGASPLRAVVRGSGGALRAGKVAFRRELARNLTLQRTLDRYIAVVLVQLTTSAVCLRHHGSCNEAAACQPHRIPPWRTDRTRSQRARSRGLPLLRAGPARLFGALAVVSAKPGIRWRIGPVVGRRQADDLLESAWPPGAAAELAKSALAPQLLNIEWKSRG